MVLLSKTERTKVQLTSWEEPGAHSCTVKPKERQSNCLFYSRKKRRRVIICVIYYQINITDTKQLLCSSTTYTVYTLIINSVLILSASFFPSFRFFKVVLTFIIVDYLSVFLLHMVLVILKVCFNYSYIMVNS